MMTNRFLWVFGWGHLAHILNALTVFLASYFSLLEGYRVACAGYGDYVDTIVESSGYGLTRCLASRN